jgi:adenylate cyclase
MREPCGLPRLGKRIFLQGAVGILAANAAGSVFVFTFTSYIAPAERTGSGSVGDDFWLLIAYFSVAALLTGRLCVWFVERSIGWVKDDRAPTDVERTRTLALPTRLAEVSFLPWIGAAAFFGTLEGAYFGHTAPFVVQSVVATLDAGLVTCTVAFLLVERAMRPLFAFALEGAELPRRRMGGVRSRLLVTWLLGSGVPLAAMAWLPATAKLADNTIEDLGRAIVVLASTGLLVGFFITAGAARTVADPLSNLRRALRQVEAGDLSAHVVVDRAGDVGALQVGLNQMVHGLRERARLEDLFGRHVGAEVAQRALEQGTGLESEQREASALFVDIIGSTAMAEVLPPGEVVATLNDYFGCVVRVVGDEGGWVNKFEGDGALCVFGAPATQPDHAARALRAARRLRRELAELRTKRPGLDVAIGVSAGPLVAGNVGTESRYEYTVIGRPVNEAARLSDLAKGKPGRVVASQAALERAGDEATRWASLGTVALRGQSAPTEIYEPVEVREPSLNS